MASFSCSQEGNLNLNKIILSVSYSRTFIYIYKETGEAGVHSEEEEMVRILNVPEDVMNQLDFKNHSTSHTEKKMKGSLFLCLRFALASLNANVL